MPRRYFRYQSLEELDREARELRLDIRLEPDIRRVRSLLGRSVPIGNHRAGNSLAIHPMEGCDGTPLGEPDTLTFRRYERFGRGGAKLIWFEATAVVPEGRANPRQLLLNDANAKSLQLLLDRTRAAHREVYGSIDDLVVVLQLTHSGRYSYPRPLICQRHPVLDPMTFLDAGQRVPIAPDYPLMDDGSIEQLEDRYAAAARLAGAIGFNGVDIKLTHGYFGNELLGAKTREGRYGGSLHNRTRFVRNVMEKIKAATGNHFLLASRIGVFDGVPYRRGADNRRGEAWPCPLPYRHGFGVNEQRPQEPDLTEPKQVIAILKQSGVSLINVSMGNPYTNPHIERPFEKPDEGNYESPEHPLMGVNRHFALCGEIQQAFPDLPIVGTGYSWLQHWQLHAGAANIRDGRATIMGIGRGSLAYPDWAKDALSKGTLDPSTTCKTLTFCTYLMRRKGHPWGQFPTGCPPFDKEVYGAVIKEARSRKR